MRFSLFAPIEARGAPSLHYRFIVAAGVLGTIALLVLGAIVDHLLRDQIGRENDAHIADAAQRALVTVSQQVDDRTRLAQVIALAPAVVSASREAGAHAQALGIVGADIALLERRFDAERSLNISVAAKTYLTDALTPLDGAEVLLTDANGYTAVSTRRPSDFVQSDEDWWRNAWRDGLTVPEIGYDSSARQTTVSIAALVRDGKERVGVVKVAFSVESLVKAMSSAGGAIRIDVLDSLDRIILSSDPSRVGRTLRVVGTGRDSHTVSVKVDGGFERAAVLSSSARRWRVAAHEPESDFSADLRSSTYGVIAAFGILLLALLLLLYSINRFLDRRLSAPARELAETAEAVAGGDFSVEVSRVTSDDEIGRLNRAVSAMVVELRRLAQAIAMSASETGAMSSEITAGSEEMAATAGEIANTASDLSAQSTVMAESIASIAESAGTLRGLAASMDEGARDGVVRNSALRTLALENRAGLDATHESLRGLVSDVQESEAAINALSDASEEIRSFVTLVRKLARQSKLLALNAAMEAARAGTQGAGFAVVASEVRRLASMSTDAAEHTEAIVRSVLLGIDASRESAGRAVETAARVRVATAKASESFTDIETAVAEAELWTASIEQTAASTSQLVVEMTLQLESLAGGTENFAASMEEIAASSEEQSASTQEIAGAANQLGTAAERLSKLVGGLRTQGAEPASNAPSSKPERPASELPGLRSAIVTPA
ncbi:MAG: methyl-accepting chemotaxis protein [Gemmatimonadota bacterium]|nr:methyl-accepting chemotaxis protein [Gemmatimonadota bacterium]